MGSVQEYAWVLGCTPQEADDHIRAALSALGHNPEGPMFSISARARRQILRKNRWAADLDFSIDPGEKGSSVLCAVEMPGIVKPGVIKEIEQELPAGLLLESVPMNDTDADPELDEDIHGIAAALERAGRQHWFTQSDEIRTLHTQMRPGEVVHELGRGFYSAHFGLAVLTNFRVFFYRKAWVVGDSVHDFPLESITNIAYKQRMSGDELVVITAGSRDVLAQMNTGRGKAFADAFHSLRAGTAQSTSTQSSTDDLVSQLERLATLRERGVLSEEEFDTAKARLLNS